MPASSDPDTIFSVPVCCRKSAVTFGAGDPLRCLVEFPARCQERIEERRQRRIGRICPNRQVHPQGWLAGLDEGDDAPRHCPTAAQRIGRGPKDAANHRKWCLIVAAPM